MRQSIDPGRGLRLTVCRHHDDFQLRIVLRTHAGNGLLQAGVAHGPNEHTDQGQVLRHDGTVQGADLTRYLSDVIEPTAVLTSTAQGTTTLPAAIQRRTPVRNVLCAVRDTFIPPPFDPNCRT